jgi:fucose 4-O-acetylase-like acetyltransferase
MTLDRATRSIVLDATKGLAIILVVYGHAIERNIANWPNVWYWAAIHHFHMPLFMFISGYLAYGRLGSKWLGRRFLQLMIPYCAWHVILYYWSTFSFSGLRGIYPTQGGLIKSLISSTASLNASGLWFLPALFALCVLIYLAKGKPLVILIITVITYIISQLSVPAFLSNSMSRIAWFMPFFACGYFISQYKASLRPLSFAKWAALVAFPLCFILGGSLNYTTPLYTWPDYTVFAEGNIVFGFYRFAMALLGIGMTFTAIVLLMKVMTIRRILCYLGLITIGIYPAHSLWMKVGIGSGTLTALLVTIIALLLSIVIVKIFQRFWITDYLFLGGAQKLVPREVYMAPEYAGNDKAGRN